MRKIINLQKNERIKKPKMTIRILKNKTFSNGNDYYYTHKALVAMLVGNDINYVLDYSISDVLLEKTVIEVIETKYKTISWFI